MERQTLRKRQFRKQVSFLQFFKHTFSCPQSHVGFCRYTLSYEIRFYEKLPFYGAPKFTERQILRKRQFRK